MTESTEHKIMRALFGKSLGLTGSELSEVLNPHTIPPLSQDQRAALWSLIDQGLITLGDRGKLWLTPKAEMEIAMEGRGD